MIRTTVCKTPWSRLDVVAAAKDSSPTSAELVIEGYIGWDPEKWWDGKEQDTTKEAIRAELKALQELRVPELTVRINSLGGEVLHGISIHDLLVSYVGKVTTVVEGMTASSATVIAQAGAVRRISANALYLIHKPMTYSVGNEDDMANAMDDLAKARERMEAIYIKAGANPETVAELMAAQGGHGRWISAEETKSAGLVDEVYEPRQMAAAVMPAPGILARLHLPPLPEQTEQTQQESIPTGASAPPAPEPKPETMMDKNQIATLRAAFGADFALEAMEKETPYEQALADGAKALATAKAELSAKVTTLEATNAELQTKVATLEAAAADPLKPSSTREVPETADAAAKAKAEAEAKADADKREAIDKLAKGEK